MSRWEYVSSWDTNGAYKPNTIYRNPKKDIVKIYGLVNGTTNYHLITELNSEAVKGSRPVIWHAKRYVTIKKSEIKEMFECDDFEIEDDD